MFITTANELDPVPRPLLDRMEIIRLSGYTEHEKIQIAKNYLVPRQIAENGLFKKEITFYETALTAIIRDYTREAGVRNLEREIGKIARKVVTKFAEGEEKRQIITPKRVGELLGHPPFGYRTEIEQRVLRPGVATGLAWTPVGGDVLFVEATNMSGKGGFQLTGQLGDVMKESAQAAFSYVRSKRNELGITPDYFEKNDIHLHVPAGAIPKDGPSAGVTIALALASLATGRLVHDNVAMTGEITLHGQVLPVGGIKEKVLAAHRLGLNTVILPERNMPDLEDLPEEVRKSMTFIPARNVDAILDVALENTPAEDESQALVHHDQVIEGS
jgi:ATP-dependent Lon protease